MSDTYTCMMFKSTSCKTDHLVFHIRNLTYTSASKICIFDRIICKFCLWCIDLDLTIYCQAVRNCGFEWTNSSLIGSPATSWISFIKHLMRSNGSFLCHQALCTGTTVEEDQLVFCISIVIVPVKYCCRLFTCQLHSTHGNCRCQVNLAGSSNSTVIQFRQEYTRTYAEDCLHFIPTTDCKCIQMIFLNIFINNNRDLGKHDLLVFRYIWEICVIFQVFLLCQYDRIVILFCIYFEEYFRKVKCFYRNTIFL